jgi:hypothetical protein
MKDEKIMNRTNGRRKNEPCAACLTDRLAELYRHFERLTQ